MVKTVLDVEPRGKPAGGAEYSEPLLSGNPKPRSLWVLDGFDWFGGRGAGSQVVHPSRDRPRGDIIPNR